MIQVNNLIKTFDGFKALDGVNMNVKRGSVYGLVGPNGAGKSTLIRHITGVMRPDAGEVFVDGENVYENSSVKSKMAYIPDDMFYFVQSDTIEMMKYYKGMYRNFDEKMFYRLQEFFPAIDVKRNIRKLSKGMQKQVAFWLSLCCRPKLIVLDEPVDGLDPVMRRQVWTFLLDDVTENGTTVMVSSHNLRELHLPDHFELSFFYGTGPYSHIRLFQLLSSRFSYLITHIYLTLTQEPVSLDSRIASQTRSSLYPTPKLVDG